MFLITLCYIDLFYLISLNFRRERKVGLLKKQSVLSTYVIMAMKNVLFLLIILAFPREGRSQNADSIVTDIAFYADVMVNADLYAHRLKAHERFSHSMDLLLSQPGSFALPLDSIPWISVLKNDKFRIVTWQLRVSNEEYKYGGFIQWPDRIKELKDTRPWVNGSLRNTYDPEAWYGSLYYEMIPFSSAGNEYYLLFGFHAENSLLNTKVAEVLDINGKELKFGLPVFLGKDDPQTRLILTYADASTVQLVFDSTLNAIVHDHLENLPGVGPAGQSLAVSDGSQEAWIFREGKWHYQEEVYDVKSEEPPMEEARKDRKEDMDILGRPKKPTPER